ncbi:MAG: matrixin family metalloprotease, partial [Acidobacteriota bacterium]|nr:matrixin family metalloprotease [Acidobacteriota bacterium]
MRVPGRIWWLAVSLLAAVIGLHGQPPLRLKTRRLDATETSARVDTGIKRRNLVRRHWVVQYPASPDPAQLADLRNRGVNILGYLPDFGFSVSATDDTNFDGLGLSSAGTVALTSKVSAEVKGEIGDQDEQFVLVEFYPDVDMNDARAMILDEQMRLQERPELLEHDLLASGTSDQIKGLALWEEVSYIFPASDELIQGLPLHACAGALTDQGAVGQSVLRVGEGWDGPGQNGADLNYAFVNTAPKLQPEAVKAEIARAFAEWAKHAKLNFTQIANPGADRTIAVLFGSRSHGDAYPFDGPGGILAHTFYPYPVNAEPLAGDMHLDADENWNIGADVDIFSVALHEAGHALGLGHSDKPGAVMYPYYRQSSALTAEDIAAILTMYAAQDGSPAANSPVTLVVNEVNLTTAEAWINLHGSASGGSGPIALSWASNRGFTGSASGSPNWSTGPITLGIGINTITIVARDSQQTQVARTLTVVRQAASSAPPVASPQINITAPAASGTYTAASASVVVSGTASDASGITRVTWTNSRGGGGSASGSTNWNTGPIPLETGGSTITIVALAQSGANVSKALEVSYAGPASGTSTAPPSLTVLSPALTSVSTSASTLSVNGTAR